MRELALVVLAGSTLAAPLASAQVKLENAWLRPAAAGQPAAMVYVDIESGAPVKLVGARSPIARSAQLVIVEPPGPDAPHKIVGEIDVPANVRKRLAYLGSHIRLVQIERDLTPGTGVPIELDFIDANGKPIRAYIDANVRGIGAQPPPDAALSEPSKPN